MDKNTLRNRLIEKAFELKMWYLQYATDNYNDDLQIIDTTIDITEKLKSVPGITVPEVNTYNYKNLEIEVNNIHAFALIKRLVGPLAESNREPLEGRRKFIKLTLKPKDKKFGGLRFWYTRKIGPGDKCKVVTTVTRQRTMQCTDK